MWRMVHRLILFIICLQSIDSYTMHKRWDEAAAVADLIKSHLEASFKIDRNCHVLTYNLDPGLINNLVKSLATKSEYPTQFFHLDGNHTDGEAIGDMIDAETWCIVAVSPAKTENIDVVDKLVKPCHNRRAIFISYSKRETRKFKHKKVQLPSLILEKAKTRRKKSKGDTFFVHAICFNCWVAKNSKIDTWKPDTGLFMPHHDYFASCCFGQTELYGKTLNVSIFGTPPYIIYDPVKKTLTGIDIDLLRILATEIKFMPNIVPEKTWGGQMKNGTLVGTVGSVYKGSSQMGIGHVLMTDSRLKLVDFTTAPYLVEYAYIVHEPLPLDPFKNVVAPFEDLLWIFLSVVTVIVSMGFYIVHRGNLEIQERAKVIGKTCHFVDYLIFPLSMLVGQLGVTWFQRCQPWSSGNIMYIVWALMSHILILAYQSNLRASMVAVEYGKPLERIQDLIDRDIEAYHIAHSSLLENLRYSPLKIHRDIYWHVQAHDTNFVYNGGIPVKTIDTILEKKRGGVLATRAFYELWKEDIFQYYGKFPFVVLPENLFSGPASIVVPKHCLWVDHFNRIISGLQSSGIIRHFYTKDVSIRWLNYARPITTQKVLELRMFYSPLIFLAAMLAIAAVVFLAERIMGRRREKKRVKKRYKQETIELSTKPKVTITKPIP